MSIKLLPCPYSGEEPLETVIDEVKHYSCRNQDCPIEDIWMTLDQWNRRFVCFETKKNGEKVFVGDKVNALKGNICRVELAPVVVPLNYKGKDVGFDRRIILGEIELVKEAEE